MPRTSLCSYTYNDADFLHGLLATIPEWTLQPDEIILLDDGSDKPFTLAESEKALPVRIIRHTVNQGFTRAKHDGICAATGDYVLSLDCDVRITPHFLEKCVMELQNPQIGLVGGGSTGVPESDDYTSWYSYAFSFGATGDTAKDSENTGGNAGGIATHVSTLAESGFICGFAFALRRELWLELGGFSSFDKNVLEDGYLSDAIRSRAYKLVNIGEPVRMLRILSRTALVRRYWQWGMGYGWLDLVRQSGQSLPQALGGFLVGLQSRSKSIVETGLTNVFYYYEILIITHTLLEFCNALGSQGQLPKEAGQSLLAGIQRELSVYPRLWMLLKSDLLKTRTLPLAPSIPPEPDNCSSLATQCDWSPYLAALAGFKSSGILAYLELQGVNLILQDDKDTATNFSSY